MGTWITVHVPEHAVASQADVDVDAVIARAVRWFEDVESVCSRFDPSSELRQVTERVSEPVVVSPMLFEALQFALAVAADTDGAFDPTIGLQMEARGFDRHYQTGAPSRRTAPVVSPASYRDVHLDAQTRSVTLNRPLGFDLGAVAKGLAVDLGARELEPLGAFVIDAGGDLYLGGRNDSNEPWAVGIRHPRSAEALIDLVRVSDRAVCTTGDYERRTAHGHHVLDPRSGRAGAGAASVTVVAGSAMVADALSTAAFVLGPVDGLALLERQGVEGLIVTPNLECVTTADFPGERRHG